VYQRANITAARSSLLVMPAVKFLKNLETRPRRSGGRHHRRADIWS
jgi:hypothetical protein